MWEPLTGVAGLKLEWIVAERVCLLDSEDPAANASVRTALERAGFTAVVTVPLSGSALMWGLPGSSLRHYCCAFADPTHPTARDLHDLNEYCLYELAQGRRVPIWVEDGNARAAVAASLRAFFAAGVGEMDAFVRAAMRSQGERALALPRVDRLARCDLCVGGGCATDWVCHVTDAETALRIVESGRLLSACRARQLPGEVLAREPRNAAGDPPDYFRYVMFAAGNCPGPDKLVYERAAGRVPSWEEYAADPRPAPRFFFRTADLLIHPGYCSDGYHAAKIRDELSLDEVAPFVVVPEELPEAGRLLERAGERLPSAELISLGSAGYSPVAWAHRAYRAARAAGARRDAHWRQ